jgi:hypothetical protein
VEERSVTLYKGTKSIGPYRELDKYRLRCVKTQEVDFLDLYCANRAGEHSRLKSCSPSRAVRCSACIRLHLYKRVTVPRL